MPKIPLWVPPALTEISDEYLEDGCLFSARSVYDTLNELVESCELAEAFEENAKSGENVVRKLEEMRDMSVCRSAAHLIRAYKSQTLFKFLIETGVDTSRTTELCYEILASVCCGNASIDEIDDIFLFCMDRMMLTSPSTCSTPVLLSFIRLLNVILRQVCYDRAINFSKEFLYYILEHSSDRALLNELSLLMRNIIDFDGRWIEWRTFDALLKAAQSLKIPNEHLIFAILQLFHRIYDHEFQQRTSSIIRTALISLKSCQYDEQTQRVYDAIGTFICTFYEMQVTHLLPKIDKIMDLIIDTNPPLQSNLFKLLTFIFFDNEHALQTLSQEAKIKLQALMKEKVGERITGTTQ